MAEKNPLLSGSNKVHGNIRSVDDNMSISSAGSEHHILQANHPPAEIRQKHETSHGHGPGNTNSSRNRNTDNKRRFPVNRSPNSSRSRTEKIQSYNLEYRGKIPLASRFFFFFISFGIILTIIAMVASAYLILTSDTSNHSDISNIILPIVIYIMNVVECSLFFLEARTFQMRGYTQLFQDASKLSKINFRFISVYYVVALSIYGFLMHHTDHNFPGPHDRDDIFLGIWYFAYVFIIGCLFNFGKKFYVHNREQPKPDLFFPNPNNNNYIQNSPRIRAQKDISASNINNISIADDQTEVVQKLHRDKQTLMRQLDNMKKKYERIQRELQQIQSDNTSSILGGGGGGGVLSGGGNGNIAIKNDVSELKKKIQKLSSRLRGEREQSKTLATQIETKRTMLDAQISETQQLRIILQAKDDRIKQLMNDKESLERGINACNDQKDDLLLLYQVKEQEVEIAKKENERLRKKMQQMTMQNQNY